MTERKAMILSTVAQTIVALCFLYFAVAAYGAGDKYGPFLAFYGMLMWALAERDFRSAMALVKEALDGWKRNVLLRSGERDGRQ